MSDVSRGVGAPWPPSIMLVKVGNTHRGYLQVIEWIQQPTDINALREFEVWKKKCDVKVGHLQSTRISNLE